MIQSALSALGTLAKPSNKFVWFIDSRASNIRVIHLTIFLMLKSTMVPFKFILQLEKIFTLMLLVISLILWQ